MHRKHGLAPALMTFVLVVPPAFASAQQAGSNTASGALGAPAVTLSLGDAVQRAAGQAPAVALSALQVSAAEGRTREVRSALLPTLTGSASWVDRSFNKNTLGINLDFPGMPSIPDLIGPFDTYDARFQVRQALVDVPGILRVKAAGSTEAATGAERDVAAESAAQRAAAAYLAAARGGALVRARQADVALARELVDLAETELQAGVGTGIDVTRARTQLVGAEGQEQVAENQRDQAQIDLARALGLDPATRFTLEDSLTTLPELTLPLQREAALAEALRSRPELLAVGASLDAAREARRSIRSERLPRLDLVADYGLNGPAVSNTIRTGQIGVSVSLPLLDGLGREARLDEQDAAIRQADIRQTDARQQVQADVESALLALHSGEQQLDIARQRLQLAEQELQQARDRFTSGVAGNIEVINAQSSLIRARDADIDARYGTALARVALARALGAARNIH